MRKGYIGARLKSVTAPRLLQGKGVYVDDLKFPRMLAAHFVRSPHAHAHIKSIDATEARSAPGVAGVYTAAELPSTIKGLLPAFESPSYRVPEWPPLATKACFVGQAVAVVVATDRYRAEDAAETIQVDYEPLEPIADIHSKSSANGAQLHEEVPGNLLFEYAHESGDIQKAFRDADIHIRRTFQHPRTTGLAIENRGVAAQYDESQQTLTVWSSTQIPDLLRKTLADCLQFPAHRLRVIAPDVGGGFGPKMQVFPEEVIVAFLAKELRRPVKWIEDRRENLMTGLHARDHVLDAEIAARGDGMILGLRVRDLCDAGAYSTYPCTCTLEPMTCASALPGPYHIQNYSFHGQALATAKCPTGAYRGVGFVLSNLVTECLMDQVAAQTGIDPAEVRRRNFVAPDQFPHRSAAGMIYDSGNYPAILDHALEKVDYQQWRNRQRELRAERRYIGIGLSTFVEPTGMGRKIMRRRGMVEVPAFDSATIKMDPSGTVRAYLSTPSQGQAQQTTFAQLLAGELGLRLDQVSITLGDTETCPSGNGTFASRSLVSAGSALALAARELREKLLCAAGSLLKTPPDQLEIADGMIVAPRTAASVSVQELAHRIHSPLTESINEAFLSLEITRSFSLDGAAISCGTHCAVVEVDAETGIVTILRYAIAEDCGTLINPAVVDGQIRGGVLQGIGAALYEKISYDDQGQILTASLMDYLAPGAAESPAIAIEHLETPSPLTPTGGKGVGESGTIAAPAAIANAVSDALAPFGVSFTKLPITPADIVRAVGKAVSRAQTAPAEIPVGEKTL